MAASATDDPWAPPGGAEGPRDHARGHLLLHDHPRLLLQLLRHHLRQSLDIVPYRRFRDFRKRHIQILKNQRKCAKSSHISAEGGHISRGAKFVAVFARSPGKMRFRRFPARTHSDEWTSSSEPRRSTRSAWGSLRDLLRSQPRGRLDARPRAGPRAQNRRPGFGVRHRLLVSASRLRGRAGFGCGGVRRIHVLYFFWKAYPRRLL